MSKGYSGLSGSSGISAGGAAKVGDEVYVADWFRFDLPEYATQPSWVRIVEESASGKAWKVDIETETKDGERDLHFTKFIPKAAVKTESQVRAEEKQAQKRFESGAKRYNAMVEFAKSNGVKGVRVGLRKETILEKIRKAGLSYKY